LASLGIEGSDGIMDDCIEGVCIGEGLVGEVMAFEVAPPLRCFSAATRR
jgi:hypothetical protein